jgi:glycosyltransferase involved in cell wall biosynthesis
VLSSATEGLPLALLEALTLGRAVVATRVGGVPDVVDDGRTGLLVDPGDPVALAKAIERLLDDEALRRQLGNAGRELMAREHSVAAMVERTIALYDRLKSERRR